ncbi:cysteine hydrolase family protein [Nitriliruptor alkaliphilus]|uniref:cysteine hydrolase family protein n=1 Tax=Nitriliruptor alkaliphilus TaxID=427918 RepID=UPI0009F99F58|nr:cysteine hydrolase family protein [Nitriliruptor alkaliphilus]
MARALVVVDVQRGFDDPSWGRRDEVDAEANIARLIGAWQDRGDPIVVVRHDSVQDGSPLRPGQPGNDLVDAVAAVEPALLVIKSVNSCFYGEPDLHAWLQGAGLGELAICGITTSHCCETTARMAGNLGYDVRFVLDATVSFDRPAVGGGVVTAEEMRRATAAALDGEFAEVATTAEALR